MSSASPGESANEGLLAQPSLRGRIITSLTRMIVKRWPRGDYRSLVPRARLLLELPAWLSFAVSRDINYTKVQGTDICGEWVAPDENYFDGRVLLYLHGGGYVSCNPQTHRSITATLARLLHWRVFALDYRLAPEAPFPAAVDDAVRAFSWLMEQGFHPGKIALAGDSSGGGLVIATMLRLRARELPLPGCAVCLSPWVDLTGEWNYGNAESCATFRPEDIPAFAELYLNGASARTPEASPIFADLKGLPPLLVQVSTIELLYDEAVRLHEIAEKSGVASTLRAFPGLPHVWQILSFLLPEAASALEEIAWFVDANTK